MVNFRNKIALFTSLLTISPHLACYDKPDSIVEPVENRDQAPEESALPASFSNENPRFNHLIKIIENTHIPSMTFRWHPAKEKFNNLIFNQENVEDFSFMLSLLENAKNGKLGDISIPTAYLMYGARGNGRKSWIYKLAAHAEAHIIYINCLGLECPYIQMSSINLRQLFEIAAVLSMLDSKKVFLVLDNLNIIAPRNSQNPHPLVRDLEMGLRSIFEQGNFNIFTFAIVEDRFSIDLNLLGNDKLGFSFGFDNPREQTRLDYLTMLANKYTFSKRVKLEDWSQRLNGFSFYAIENLINNAYLASKRVNKTKISEKKLNAIFKNYQTTGNQDVEATPSPQVQTELLDGDSSLSIQIWPRDSVKYNFSDVVADEKTKEEVSDILLFIKEPKRFEKTRGRIPSGIILYGPTGTGKTLFAKALAGEAGCSFISVNASMLTSKYLGDSSRNVKNLFKIARKIAKQDNKPCIVFIDEIDSFAMRRGSSYGTVNDDNRQMLNQFLCELDGFGTEHGQVILVAATNRFNDLDPAVKRPGRLDRHVCLPSPTSPLRKKIFALAAAKFNFDAGVQLDELAKMTVGFSGADIMNMANEAAIIAAKEDCEFITQEHLLSAHEKVTIGVENRSLKISEEERKITAYHESGHALVALLMPQATPLKRLTCIPRGNALGVTRCYEDVDKFSKNEKLLFANLSVFFGGLVAEEILTGSHDTGSADDLEKATTLAEMMVCDFGMSPLGNLCIRGRYVSNEKVSQAITELLSKAEKAARDVLENHKAELECLANKLLEAETMSGDEVRTLIAEVERAKTSHVATQELG